MDSRITEVITSAVVPIVMVSTAGLLSTSVQAKNLHLADRVRALMAEFRTLTSEVAHQERRTQIVEQLRLFKKRISLSQHALEFIYGAMVTFVVTSLLLAATPWLDGAAALSITAAVFVLGVGLLLVALVLEFWEMHLGLRTVDIESSSALEGR